MREQQLFLGDPVVIQFTAQRVADGRWNLVTRVVHEFQDWSTARFDEYPCLSPVELHELLDVITERLVIL